VDLEKRRVVQLLAERSVETSKAWLRKHPEIDLVSRDRGKPFREAATDGAPQAKQVVDRFHLQKNFAEALENFFRKQERVLKNEPVLSHFYCITSCLLAHCLFGRFF
jgi:transposase